MKEEEEEVFTRERLKEEKEEEEKARRRLKKEEEEVLTRAKEFREKHEKVPEWVFKVLKEPAGVIIEHYSKKYSFSRDELNALVRGEVTMANYPFLPKGMYRAFMLNVTDALGLVYRPYMVERVTPEAMPKARIEFKQKSEVEKMLERTEDLKVKYRIIGEEIKALEEFWKMVKKK